MPKSRFLNAENSSNKDGGAKKKLGIIRRLGLGSRANILLGLAIALVAFVFIQQAGFSAKDNPYSAMRQDDLIQVLDGLDAETSRLNDQVDELRRTRDELASGADARQVNERQAQRRYDSLAVLAGTVPAEGQGIRIIIYADETKLDSGVLLNSIQELKDAGAEAIEINDTIRLGTQSWFDDQDGQIIIDGNPVSLPLVIDVIGDPHSLEEGAKFRGGLVSQVESPQVGGQVVIDTPEIVEIDSTLKLLEPQVARPA